MCCGCVAVLVNLIFVIILSCFAIFKNVAHSLKPGETPRCATFLNNAKYFKTVHCGCGCGAVAVIFSIYLNAVLYT